MFSIDSKEKEDQEQKVTDSTLVVNDINKICTQQMFPILYKPKKIKQNDHENNNEQQPHEKMNETVRLFKYFCLGFLFPPIFCFLGHTRHYIFDNYHQTFQYHSFRGMCCFGCDSYELEASYSDIKYFQIFPKETRSVKDPSEATLQLNFKDESFVTLTSSKSTLLVSAREQVERLSNFTGIPVFSDKSGAFAY
eukprot:gb/GECH01012725.1/.p1 GENE.gb/GECH01012725.1/~~gb/GECH01012725.1/.p1  ORF type:complete len:194 (+),score=30.75 gb/GECH01012725.1/:1-582(+)